MKTTWIIILMCMGFAFSPVSGETVFINCDEDAGRVKGETREIPSFARVEVEGPFSVVIEKGKENTVLIRAQEKIIPLIRTRVEEETLFISSRNNFCATKDLKITVFYRETIKAISFAGSVDGIVENLETDAIQFSLSGSSSLVAKGSAQKMDIQLEGSSSLDAEHLHTETATAHLDGASDALIYTKKALKADIFGASGLVCHGRPEKVEKHITGAGDFTMK